VHRCKCVWENEATGGKLANVTEQRDTVTFLVKSQASKEGFLLMESKKEFWLRFCKNFGISNIFRWLKKDYSILPEIPGCNKDFL
jgi:hypothetical protein